MVYYYVFMGLVGFVLLLYQVVYIMLYYDILWLYESYFKIGGYVVLCKIFEEKILLEQVIEMVKQFNLCGCGGVGFLIGLKWFFMFKGIMQKYIFCNLDEFELGICKDCDILCYNLYLVVEGMVIVCYVIGSIVGYNYLCGEFYYEFFEYFEQVLVDVYVNGWLGKNIFGSGVDIDIYGVFGVGVYICGEEIVLMELLEGKKGQLCYKLLFLVNFGLYGKLLMINNIEIYVLVLVIICNGLEWFQSLSLIKNGGLKIFLVFGCVQKGGNFEVLLGIIFDELLEMVGGFKLGCILKGVVLGGVLMLVFKVEEFKGLQMDYDILCVLGIGLGLGVIVVFDDSVCCVKFVCCILQFFYKEFCGQCILCCEGIGWMYCVLECIVVGKVMMEDLYQLKVVVGQIEGYIICVFGEVVVWFIQGFLCQFWDEFEYYIVNGYLMVDGKKVEVVVV